MLGEVTEMARCVITIGCEVHAKVEEDGQVIHFSELVVGNVEFASQLFVQTRGPMLDAECNL